MILTFAIYFLLNHFPAVRVACSISVLSFHLFFFYFFTFFHLLFSPPGCFQAFVISIKFHLQIINSPFLFNIEICFDFKSAVDTKVLFLKYISFFFNFFHFLLRNYLIFYLKIVVISFALFVNELFSIIQLEFYFVYLKKEKQTKTVKIERS